MDIVSLRVFNGMYNLEITEEEFQAIEKEVNTSATGIANCLIRKNRIVYVDHDEKNDIVVSELKKEIQVPSRVLLKTLITCDVPAEVYTLHSAIRYHAHDWEPKATANDLEAIKDKIRRRLSDLELEIDENNLKLIYWLFDKQYEKIKVNVRPETAKIIKVFEKNNVRVAIIKEANYHTESCNMGYHYQRIKTEDIDYSYEVRSFTTKDAEYDYVDEGREIYHSVWLEDDLTGKVSYGELEILNNRLENHDRDDFNLLSLKDYNSIKAEINAELMAAKRKTEKAENVNEAKKQAAKIFGSKGKIIRNGIKITKNSIEYDGYVIKGYKVQNFITENNVVTKEDIPDFNTLFSTYLNYLLQVSQRSFRNDYNKPAKYVYDFDEEHAKVDLGKITNIDLSVEKSNLYVTLDGEKFRIRRDEIYKVLNRVLSYKTNAEYKEFLASASRITLRVAKAVENGVSFNLQSSPSKDACFIKDNVKMVINLSVFRKDNKNYLRIGDKELKIKDFETFYSIQDVVENYRIPAVQRVIKILNNSIEGITPQDMGDLIKQGKAQYENRLKNSKEFIENALRITSGRKVSNGYVVKGLSGREYHVSFDNKVHRYEKDKCTQYICIVDVDSDLTDAAGINDCIAKRLLFLHKDTKMAKEVYTLNLNTQEEEDVFLDDEMEEVEA